MLKLKLSQQPYIDGCDELGGVYFHAAAVNMDDENDDGYEIFWDVYVRWLRSGDDDHSNACNWGKYRVYDPHGDCISRRKCRVYDVDGTPMWE